MSEQVYTTPGIVTFRHEGGEGDEAHVYEVTIGWGRDYPAVVAPRCDDCGVEYERTGDDDHAANLRDPLTEDELIEREAKERYAVELAESARSEREVRVRAKIDELRAANTPAE